MPRNSKDKTPRDSEEQEEMTVVVLRFRGGSQSLQKGFDTVSQALAALRQSPIHHRRLSGIAGAPAEIREAPGAGTPDEVQGSDEGSAPVDVESHEETRQRGSRGLRRYSTPTFVSDLDLTGGGVGWKDYAGQKSPQSANEKYLLAAAWLTKHAGRETFTVDHIFTCFRAMEWEEQRDFGQPLRLMKSKKSYLELAREHEKGCGEKAICPHQEMRAIVQSLNALVSGG